MYISNMGNSQYMEGIIVTTLKVRKFWSSYGLSKLYKAKASEERSKKTLLAVVIGPIWILSGKSLCGFFQCVFEMFISFIPILWCVFPNSYGIPPRGSISYEGNVFMLQWITILVWVEGGAMQPWTECLHIQDLWTLPLWKWFIIKSGVGLLLRMRRDNY